MGVFDFLTFEKNLKIQIFGTEPPPLWTFSIFYDNFYFEGCPKAPYLWLCLVMPQHN